MSKIGKQIILLPSGVILESQNGAVKITGPKGSLELKIPRKIELKVSEGQVEVVRTGQTKQIVSLHGTIRSLINNMVVGVTTGFSKQMELIGTGFRAEVSGKTLTLIVGFSHPVKLDIPDGVNVKVEKNILTVDGFDKELVGQFSANVRAVRPPEPYKGKGIKYVDETIRRKPGKAAAKAGGAA